jgi:small-conductance mechanosensitive channel
MLNQHFYGVLLRDWSIAAALALSVTLLLSLGRGLARRLVERWAEATERRWDDVIAVLIASFRIYFFLALGLWTASEYVQLSPTVVRVGRVAVTLTTLLQIGLSAQEGARAISSGWLSQDADGQAKTAASAVSFLVSLGVWAALAMVALSTLGFEISALVAGLGVGGVAAALAVQSILGDLFASLSIYFDRPFYLGDFIIVDDSMGTVEKIGLRTTRLRALGGEQLIFANGELIKSRIQNFKRMQERRIVFKIGVEYSTPHEELRAIPKIVSDILERREGTRLDRAHLAEFGDFSLNYEIVYFVSSPDYNAYMDHQHAINLALVQAFADRGIAFAFPTQTVVLRSSSAPSQPLAAK